MYACSDRPSFSSYDTGVGFSYAEYGESVSTTEEASIDIARFMFLFFENFPQFKGRDLHLSGESYGVMVTLSFMIKRSHMLARVVTYPSSALLSSIKMPNYSRRDSNRLTLRHL